MNIAYITLAEPAGTSGQDIYSLSVATALAKHPDVDLTLICPSPSSALPSQLEKHDITTAYLPAKETRNISWHIKSQWYLHSALKKAVNSRHIDAIVTTLKPALLTPPVFAKFNDIPQVLLVEGMVASQAKQVMSIPGIGLFTNFTAALNASVSSSIYVADEATLQWIRSLPGSTSNVERFVHGVNTNLFAPESRDTARRNLDFGINDEFVVGFVGSFKPYHCLEPLLRAVASDELSDVHLLLVGEGLRYDYIRDLSRELGLADRVHMPGFIEHNQVSRYITACDALYGVIEPDRPNSPLKVYEYLACGRPVIVYEDEEFRFLNELGAGELITEVSPTAIVQSIDDLRSMSPERRKEIEEAASEYIRKNQTWDTLADKIVSCVSRCASDTSKRS